MRSVKKLPIIFISYFSISIICLLDIYTGYEINLAILYFLPFYFYCSNLYTTKKDCFTFSILLSIVWTLGNVLTKHKFQFWFIPYFNCTLRVLILVFISHLLYKYKIQNQELEDKNQQLSRLNEEKNKFIGVVAHDLRSPSGQILAMSDLLIAENQKTEGNTVYLLDTIKKISSKMLKLIEGILNITDIEKGNLQLMKTENEYIAFVREIILHNQYLANKKNIVIQLTTEIELCNLSFDTVYLELVFNNLLSNAIKYSYSNSKIMVIIKKEKSTIKTEIIDTGVGIKDDEIANLFNPFTKGSIAPTEGETSNGLGLFLVKKVIETHGGNIYIDSKLSEGSTFYFYMPCIENE